MVNLKKIQKEGWSNENENEGDNKIYCENLRHARHSKLKACALAKSYS